MLLTMKWSWQIARIRGVEVRIHATFVLLLAWIGLSAWAEGGSLAALGGVGFALLVFTIVVLHELGHAMAAQHYGIRTRDITLLPIGGIARLDRIPEEPRAELVIATAGPAVNLALAAVLAAAAFGLGQPLVPAEPTVSEMPLLARLVWINLSLGAFNLIPAFPMDGGRMLRAFLAMRMDHARATRIASRLGGILAIALGFFGLFTSAVLVLIAVFVWLGAAAENSAEQLRTAARGVRIADAMARNFETLAPTDTLATAAAHVIAGFQTHFPVVDDGAVVGVLSHGELIGGLAENGPDATVGRVMRRDIRMLDAFSSLEDGLEQLQPVSAPPFVALPVAADGRLVGMLTLEGIGELVALRTAVATTTTPRRGLSRGLQQPAA
jgi:Zn-dependent protease/CBS domain-containing protein